MKKIYSLVAVLAATLSMNAQTALNVNGSLEDWTDAATEPAGWYIQGKLNDNLVSRGTGNSAHGNYHLVIAPGTSDQNNTPTLQDIVVTPNTEYTVSFYYKSDVGASFKHWFQFRDASDNNIAVQNNPAQPSGQNSNLPVVADWTLKTVTFTTPANTAELRVGFRNYNGANVYIDNVNVVLGATASNTENNIDGLNIFPNPATDLVNVTSNTFGAKQVQLFDMVGKKVLDIETNDVFNVSGLNQGIYVMKVTEAGRTATRKLVIK